MTEVLDLSNLGMMGKKVSILSATAKYLIMVSAVMTTNIFYELRSFMMVLFINNCN